MRNKPNLLTTQMNLSKALAKNYVIFRLRSRFKNKPNQTQFVAAYLLAKPDFLANLKSVM